MENFFRERVWGSLASAQYWLRERYCIMENLALDPITGGDPKDIKLRSSQGFAAADYFIGNDWMWGNYWVWSKILENLADLEYDSNTMTMEAYDWRLGMKMLEERDSYFTHLKFKIETYHKISGEKVVLTSHSMGAIVVHYFFAWVTEIESKGGGGGGKNWVDDHIHAYVNIAGSHLGVPKAASALASGETSDSVFTGGFGNVVERFLPRKARREMYSTWGSLWAMLPKGGDALWSVGADMPEVPSKDAEAPSDSTLPPSYKEAIQTNMFVMSDNEDVGTTKTSIESDRNDLLDPETQPVVNKALQLFSSRMGQTTQNIIDFLLTWGGGLGPSISPVKLYSFSPDPAEEPSSRTWHDISRTPLPHAPNMKIYCLYGVGVETERAFFYKRNSIDQGLFAVDNRSDDGKPQKAADPPFILDTSVEDLENGIVHGIKYSDGDGSVPLLSLGYMCAGPWRHPESGLNPSGSKIITREYKHRTGFTVDDPMRKGPHSSEHVDVLGNHDMLHDFVKIVSGEDVDSITDNIVSDIENIVKRIQDHPNGGLGRPPKRVSDEDVDSETAKWPQESASDEDMDSRIDNNVSDIEGIAKQEEDNPDRESTQFQERADKEDVQTMTNIIINTVEDILETTEIHLGQMDFHPYGEQLQERPIKEEAELVTDNTMSNRVGIVKQIDDYGKFVWLQESVGENDTGLVADSVLGAAKGIVTEVEDHTDELLVQAQVRVGKEEMEPTTENIPSDTVVIRPEDHPDEGLLWSQGSVREEEVESVTDNSLNDSEGIVSLEDHPDEGFSLLRERVGTEDMVSAIDNLVSDAENIVKQNEDQPEARLSWPQETVSDRAVDSVTENTENTVSNREGIAKQIEIQPDGGFARPQERLLCYA